MRQVPAPESPQRDRERDRDRRQQDRVASKKAQTRRRQNADDDRRTRTAERGKGCCNYPCASGQSPGISSHGFHVGLTLRSWRIALDAAPIKPLLARRAAHVPIRAEDAAIAASGTQRLVTSWALVKEETRVGRHVHLFTVATVRTRDRRLELERCHWHESTIGICRHG